MSKSLNKNTKNPVVLNKKKKKKSLLIYQLIIFIFAFILYGNTIPNDYCLDDNLVVQNNEQVMKGIKAIPEIFTSHYRESERNEYGYRPIAKVTFAIESQFFKQNPHVSHLINVLLYAILLLLLFKILNNIFPELPVFLRFVIILLFAAHPIHTEVVASLKNREELLCFLYAAAAVLLLMKVFAPTRKKIIYVVLGIICIALSVLSKQTGLVFCAIIPLILLQFYYKPFDLNKILSPENKSLFWKYFFLLVISLMLGWASHYFHIMQDVMRCLFYGIVPLTLLYLFVKKSGIKKELRPEDKSMLWRYLYLAVFSLAIILLGYFLFKMPEIILPSENKILNGFENPLFLDNSLYNKICMGFMGLLYYLKLMFIPYPLCFYYGFDTVPLTEIGDFRILFSVFIHLLLFIAGIYLFYKNKIISFGILFYLIGLTMFANLYLSIPGIIGERLLFVSSFGFCIVIGGVVWMLQNKWIHQGKMKTKKSPWMIYIIISVIILIFSIQTIARNNDWKNHASLYKADIVHLENSSKANSLYADELMRQAYESISKNKPADKTKIELALKHYLKAIEIYPDYPSAYNNIGSIYFMFYKDYKSALPYFEKAEEVDSLSSETVYNLAFVYEMTGDTAKALTYYEKAVKKDTTNVELISRWANLVNKTGNLDHAIELNMKIAKMNPSSDRPYINIGNYYCAMKDTATAVNYWEKAIAVAPANDYLNTFLAEYFKKKGNSKKSLFYSQKITPKVN